jgi:hypothetical protein
VVVGRAKVAHRRVIAAPGRHRAGCPAVALAAHFWRFCLSWPCTADLRASSDPPDWSCPVTSIIAINVGHATRKTLPKTAVRDRRVAEVGIALAALPLALIMLGIIVIEFLVGFSIIFGHQ